MNPDELMAAFRARNDQAEEGTRQMAATLAAFYRHLVEGGVPPEYAGDLTSQFLANVFEMNQS